MREDDVVDDSQSVKEKEGEVIDRDPTARGPHLNKGRCRRVLRLLRYARLRSCFAVDLRYLITSRESTLLARARPVDSKGKLFNSLPVD